MILPHANEVDLDELPADVRKEMTFVPVRTLEEALAISMPEIAPAARRRRHDDERPRNRA